MAALQETPVSGGKNLGLLRHSTMEPFRTVAPEGQPYLLLGTTSLYSWMYSDAGTGARMDVTFWRPTPSDPSYYIIGDYAQGNYSDPIGPTITVAAVNDPDGTLLKPPVDYIEIWNDHGSGGDHDGSIWYPKPPDNFVTIGFVVQRGYDKPSIGNYRCIHHSQVTKAEGGGLIWNDQKSGARKDVSVFAVPAVPGIFVAQGTFDSIYSGPAHQFKIA